ncbi:MAG: alpha/beta fold hydrolase [Bacteroidota bacterium]
MKSHRLEIPNRLGLQLSASLELPIGEKPSAYAIFAHCFTCGKNLKGERNVALALTQAGYAVLRFDFAGVGESEGEFYHSNFTTRVSDLEDVAAYLAEHYEAPKLMVGHSLGGAAAILGGSRIDSIQAIATIGAPAEPAHVAHLFDLVQNKIQQEGEAQVLIGGRPFVIQRHFLEDIRAHSLAKVLPTLNKALLIMHSPQDTVVGVENARQLYVSARHPKSFLSLDGADHLLMAKADSLYAGEMIAGWSKRYVDLTEPEPLLTDKQTAVRTGADSYTTEVRAGNHSFLADEPKSVGGDDLGPTPYDLLLASLGACTSMTLRMYADRKKWDLLEVRVHLEHYKDYPEDAGHPDEKPSKLDHIDRFIELEGNLDEAQRARLMEIADKCPVHRTLHSQILIRTHARND